MERMRVDLKPPACLFDPQGDKLIKFGALDSVAIGREGLTA